MNTRQTQGTTSARDASVMRTHVLPQWGNWQLRKIDHMEVQTWVTELGKCRSHWVVAKALQLTSNVMRSAVRSRLIGTNPCEDVALPEERQHDTDERIISRQEFRYALLPVVPHRYRALVAVAAGTGLRWGEVAGLCTDAVDPDAGKVRVIRTVVEVAGNTAFKPFPKSRAGRRTVPLPGWAVTVLREHMEAYPPDDGVGLIFANEAAGGFGAHCSARVCGDPLLSVQVCSGTSGRTASSSRPSGLTRSAPSQVPGSTPRVRRCSRWRVTKLADSASTTYVTRTAHDWPTRGSRRTRSRRSWATRT